MPDEINNKKLQYLKRDEVRTMEKDIARLRERESEATREKIAQIKTGEETGLEAARIEQSKRAAQERERLEFESKRKEEELEKIRERKAADLSAEVSRREMKAEEEKEQLRAQLRGAQLKEEEARRKFLENIARQSGEVRPDEATEEKEAEEKPYEPPAPPPIRPRPPVPPLPADVSAEAPAGAKVEAPLSGAKEGLPADVSAEAPAGAKVEAPLRETKEGLPGKKPFKFPLPSFKIPEVRMPKVHLPEVKLPKVEGYFPERPSIFEKIWVRILISLFVIAVLTTLVTFWYWYLAVRPQMSAPVLPAAETPQEEKLEITQRLLQGGYYIPASARVIGSIVIHSGYNKENPYDLESAIQSYGISGTAVHYLISRQGAVFQLAPDYAVAYHAGNANNVSIGISLIYQESESPNEDQYQSLSRLIKDLQEKYNIPMENVRGYKDISPTKTTPWNFDQEYLESLFK